MSVENFTGDSRNKYRCAPRTRLRQVLVDLGMPEREVQWER